MIKSLVVSAIALALSVTTVQANFPGQRWQPCDNLPPMSARQPLNDFVKVEEFTRSSDAMWKACGVVKRDGVMYGCEYRVPGYLVWRVFYNSALTPAEKACTKLIEYGHLPPNNWYNPLVESMTQHTHR